MYFILFTPTMPLTLSYLANNSMPSFKNNFLITHWVQFVFVIYLLVWYHPLEHDWNTRGLILKKMILPLPSSVYKSTGRSGAHKTLFSPCSNVGWFVHSHILCRQLQLWVLEHSSSVKCGGQCLIPISPNFHFLW